MCSSVSPHTGTSAAVSLRNARVLQEGPVTPAEKPSRGQKSQSQGSGGASRQGRVPGARGIHAAAVTLWMLAWEHSVTLSFLLEPRRCAATSPTSRCWRPGGVWRGQTTTWWASQSCCCLTRPCATTLEGRRMKVCWKSLTPHPLWRCFRRQRSKSNATSQRDGFPTGPPSPGGITRSDGVGVEIMRPNRGTWKLLRWCSRTSLCCRSKMIVSVALPYCLEHVCKNQKTTQAILEPDFTN